LETLNSDLQKQQSALKEAQEELEYLQSKLLEKQKLLKPN